MTAKPVKRVDLSKLTPPQREAFIQLVKDANKAEPGIRALHETARAVWEQWLRSPTWAVVQTPPPDDDGVRPVEGWDIGAPEVNYIEPESEST